jgi:SAM-dependent methyltransferase
MTTPSSSFDELCAYWEFFERSGLNENVLELSEYIRSPVLLLGSGQGVVSQALLDQGLDVTNVDISNSMIQYARSRRNVETIEANAASVSFDRKFNTILVNTGILTEENIRTSFNLDLLKNVDKHLAERGRVLLAYLRCSFSIKVFERLGLLGRPSNNAIFWSARESLEKIKESFIASGYEKDLIDLLFVLCEDDLDKHREFITRVGNEYLKVNETTEPSSEFLDKCADFAACFLKSETEHILIQSIEERYAIVSKFDADNGTRIVVYERK